jgi:hypothetical protein
MRATLAGAEVARIEGRAIDVERLYEEATKRPFAQSAKTALSTTRHAADCGGAAGDGP